MSYLGIPPFGHTVRTVTEVTATSGQTTFTPTGGYIVGYVDVYLNGILLQAVDYTAADGSTVVLTSAAALNDEIKMISYMPVSLADGYTKTEADARYLSSTNGSVTADKLASNAVTTAKIANGAVTAEKLGFTLSSNALSQSIPLKSGKTLTAGRAVNINSSGEVGDYPVVNTSGTPVQNTTTNYFADIGFISTDGSRIIKFANPDSPSSGNPFSVRGVALTSTGQTTGSTVSLGATGGYNFYGVAKPINETQFLISYITTNGTDYNANPATSYYYLRVATVDSSGNVSLGTASSFSLSQIYLGYGAEVYLSALPSGRFTWYAFGRNSDYNTLYYRSKTVSISGTTVTVTEDNDMDFFSHYPAFVTTNNKLVGTRDNTFYYCNYDGSVTSSYASADLRTNGRGGAAIGIMLSASYGLFAYNKSNYDFVVDTFSVNQTTGAPTTTSSNIIVPATAVAASNLRFVILSSTEVLLAYKIGTTSYALSLKLNASAQIIGKGIPVITNSQGYDVHDFVKSGTNTVRYLYNVSTTGYSNDITINSYDTLSWTSVGAVATSQTTSPATIVVNGICSGFTGLTPGSKYYVNESTYNGEITSTLGNYLVGTAISSTEILLG